MTHPLASNRYIFEQPPSTTELLNGQQSNVRVEDKSDGTRLTLDKLSCRKHRVCSSSPQIVLEN